MQLIAFHSKFYHTPVSKSLRKRYELRGADDYDIYLREASRGRSFLAVRPASYAQLKQIRDLLAPHRAYLAKYIDTWTLTELLP